jgi:hypothetical protein
MSILETQGVALGYLIVPRWGTRTKGDALGYVEHGRWPIGSNVMLIVQLHRSVFSPTAILIVAWGNAPG